MTTREESGTKQSACPRLFEVEAMRDGRLGEAERVSFSRHLSTCLACAREAKALEALSAAVRTPADDREADELHARRERTRLLAAFDAEQIASERPPMLQLSAGGLTAAATVLGLAVIAALRLRSPPVVPSSPRATDATDAVVVHADSGARYAKRTEGNRETIILERGALRIQVTHPRGETLRVALPDGELEDVGTTFTVAVSGGRTARVAVEEGSVILRLRGAPPVRLGAGETWPSTVATPASVPEETRAPVLSPAAGPVAAPTPTMSARPPDRAADEFRAAMTAFDGGDVRGAAARFALFVVDHPDDPRAEDAAYLRVIALQRTGDDGATRRAATDYLARYPAGFRRSEVERLAQ
jgi:ferric-dicitrate binding protein FerR (iron transport regulator)